MPSVTVIIPAYNRAHTIRRALASVVGQASPEWPTEVIIVDDHSSDDLAGALRGYDASVTCIAHAENQGAAAARNTGVKSAKGEYIAFLDSDDAWLPEKLASQLAAMRARQWKASCTAYYLARPGRAPVVSPRYRTRALSFNEIIWGCVVSPGSTLVCERAVFDEIGPLDPAMKRLEDWDWLLRYTRRYPLGFLADPLAVVEPSESQNFENVAGAIEMMRERHMPTMAGASRRHFASALDVIHASAEYRRGNTVMAAWRLLRSLGRAPFGNPALVATLHNRLKRA